MTFLKVNQINRIGLHPETNMNYLLGVILVIYPVRNKSCIGAPHCINLDFCLMNEMHKVGPNQL